MRSALLTALVTVTLGGCSLLGGGESEPAFAPQAPAEIRASAALLEPIELQAAARGNGVRFTLLNNSVDNLYVGPENFALISPGVDEPLLATAEGVLVRFQPAVLNPNDSMVGEIIFLRLLDVVGHRLIYNTAQIEPRFWLAEIAPMD